MNKTRFQKVSRAAVASVLAASGTVVALPINDVKAAGPFTDVDPANFAYDAIMNLYERNIISGYGNGKFGPNDTVTRGQAAKMLAQVLELDTTNVINPNFKDVGPGDMFYPYIAALANEGIINGFIDQTYRAEEPITRGQMAIVLTKGFEFKQATPPLTHTFEDVTVNTYERYFIQTIYALGITTGKTERSFDPYGKVTRAEMAVFINRAENAKAIANPMYEVTDVHTMGNITYAYVNGVKHTVDSRLKSIFNDANAAVLEGAIIEGDLTDTKRIMSLSKITFTASGSTGRSLQFSGFDSVFAGDVAITGSYIKFRNWTVTGEVSVEPEAPRTIRAALEASPFKRVASLNNTFGFIDWGQETDPDDYEPIGGTGGHGDPWTGPADGSEDGTDLIAPPLGNETGYYKRMAPVHRYIEFLDSDIRYLVIRQSGTHITTTTTLPHVTVMDKVKAYEIYGDVGTMYIDTDVNTTMYGVSTIAEIYKNSHKSVNLDSDTRINLMVVDNSNGWIDLGEHSYIDKVIIPPNKMPNDIFNDFINDNDLIGDIEYPSGEEVDRDPIENTIVPDLEDPLLSIVEIDTELDTAEITFNSNEDGMLYYIVKKEIDGEPSIREIMQNTGSRWAGRASVAAGRDYKVEVTQLDDQTEYVVYAVVVDEAGNISDKTFDFFQITDASPPVLLPVEVTPLTGGTRAEVTFNPNEAGDYYYYYERYLFGDEIETFTSEELIALVNEGRPRTGGGRVESPGEMEFIIRELDPQMQYVFYIVMQDDTGNIMTEPVVRQFTTLQLDNVRPFVTDTTLNLIDKTDYVFEMAVNEPLDVATANDVNNYVLSGTGIVNVTGQKTIKPDQVEYIENQRKIRIRIPSASGFVDGDTLTVTVLPGVTDMAENPFESLLVQGQEFIRNSATYRHNDETLPELRITNLQTSPEGQSTLEYETTKAGTMYYMIMADSVDITKTTPTSFYNYIVGNEDESNIDSLITNSQKEILLKFGGNPEDDNTVIVGSQLHDFIIPTTADPFYSYSLYMVARDRSGKLSQIRSVPLINDAKAPFISDLAVEPIPEYNDAVEIKLKSSEQGTLYYTALPKFIEETDENGIVTIVPNPKIDEIASWREELSKNKGNHAAILNNPIAQGYLEEIKTEWDKGELAENTNIKDYGLQRHTEYVYYFAAMDTHGNITMFPEAQTGVENEYGEDLMKEEVYTDGIDPKVLDGTLSLTTKYDLGKGLLDPETGAPTVGNGKLTYIPQQTFVVTFSEAIVLADDLDDIKAAAAGVPEPFPNYYKNSYNQAGTLNKIKDLLQAKFGTSATIQDMEWEKDYQLINTWNPRRLVFTVSSSVDTAVVIEQAELGDFVDLAERNIKFDAPIKYDFHEGSLNTYLSAILIPPVTDIQGMYSSQRLLATMQINADSDWDLNYYYVTQVISPSGAVTLYSPEEVVNYVRSRSLSVEEREPFNLKSVGVYGTGKIVPPVDIGSGAGSSFPIDLILRGQNTFVTGQSLFLVTVDKYGNIVGSATHLDQKPYETIEYTPPTP